MSYVVLERLMPQSRIDASSRRRLRQAVVPDPDRPEPNPAPAAAVSGLILDASPHLIVLATPAGTEARLPMSDATSIWYAGKADLSALQPGRRAIIRPSADGLAAERVWVDIVRAAGTIVVRDGATLDVDEGPHRGVTHVAIPPRTLSQILVRHPHFEPGYLVDVIGVRSADGLLAVRPGTRSQPDYPADSVPRQRPVEPAPPVLAGAATWFGAQGGEVAYPALDQSGGGCGDVPAGYANLPYLSVGSELYIRNECTGRAARMPITQCGCVAGRFRDRCVVCEASPRGRIVELSPAEFVDLGGDLDEGCFNVTVRVG